MIALLGSIWPLIAGGALGLLALVATLFSHKNAQIAAAGAATAQAHADNANARLADAVASQNASAAATQAVQDAAASRAATDTTIAAMPGADVQKELRDEFGR